MRKKGKATDAAKAFASPMETLRLAAKAAAVAVHELRATPPEEVNAGTLSDATALAADLADAHRRLAAWLDAVRQDVRERGSCIVTAAPKRKPRYLETSR